MQPIIEAAPSGSLVNFLTPDPATIHLEDIALALSRIPRFTGHTLVEWPVVNHLLLTEWIGAKCCGWNSIPMRLHYLLHDAHEAYIGDVNTPLKTLLGAALTQVTDRLDDAIYRSVRLAPPTAEEHLRVKHADTISLFAEARILLPSRGQKWPWEEPSSDDEPWVYAATQQVRRLYLLSAKPTNVVYYERLVELLALLQASGSARDTGVVPAW